MTQYVFKSLNSTLEGGYIGKKSYISRWPKTFSPCCSV